MQLSDRIHTWMYNVLYVLSELWKKEEEEEEEMGEKENEEEVKEKKLGIKKNVIDRNSGVCTFRTSSSTSILKLFFPCHSWNQKHLQMPTRVPHELSTHRLLLRFTLGVPHIVSVIYLFLTRKMESVQGSCAWETM